jgi:ERCC4-type nuclease
MKETAPRIPVVIDTREQKPYRFDLKVFCMIDRVLPVGDYSLEGMEAHAAIERKSLVDLLGSLTGERDATGLNRFQRELQRFSQYSPRRRILLVEASWDDMYQGRWPLVRGRPCSRLTPTSAVGMLHAIQSRYCEVVMAGDRKMAARLCADILRRWWLDAAPTRFLAAQG